MSNSIPTRDEISIAHYIKEVNDHFGKNPNILKAIAENASDLASKITTALFDVGVDLAEFIQLSLMSKEQLRTVDEEHPRSTTPLAVDIDIPLISPEILGWSIAILASAWSEWVFASKSNDDSKYQKDPGFKNDASRQAAVVNVKLALPYIRNSIIDAINKAIEIGNCKETDFGPKPNVDQAFIRLRKN
jgi:hypothetical protein